ncbi:hypothetical protein [uncultured Arcticibacterium sp.]|uniref:hypothetical protein n=1 Tax=uncultured Arcticibacterium sp. TaxID=2173042 RepID=UPI0030F7A070
MKNIQLNIKGLNLIVEGASKNELLEIAEDIFPKYNYTQLCKFENYSSRLSWNFNLTRLFKEQNPPIEKEKRFSLIMEIKDEIMRMHQTLSFLENLIEQNEINFSLKVVESLSNIECGRTKDTRALGWRKVLKYYAKTADLESFKKVLKLCESGKERNEITSLKSLMVTSYSKLNGIEKGLELARLKLFGNKYLYSAVSSGIQTSSYDKMKKVLKNITDLGQEDKTALLARTFQQNAKNGNFSLINFDEIYQQVETMDPKIKFGDFRLRDTLLMDIGMNLKELDLVIKCRISIKNNNLKKELRYTEEQLK